MKVQVLGPEKDVATDEYKYAFKSINLHGYQQLISNLIAFRELKNPYVDSILNIAN